MIEIGYHQGKQVAATRTCACGGDLTLVWGGPYGVDSYILRCAGDLNHNTLASPERLQPYDITGLDLEKGRRRMEQQYGAEKTAKLVKYEGVVSLSRQQAMEVLQTIWPEAPPVEVLKAAMICHAYGLNPLMQHVFLIPFKRREDGQVVGTNWAVVIGIKASRLIAHRPGAFSYIDDTPRVMTREEQKKIFGHADDSRIWAITKLRDRQGNEAAGYGSWPKSESPYGDDKGNTKENMAFIRSERIALDRLVGTEMPGVEVIDERYVPPGGTTEVREVREEKTIPPPKSPTPQLAEMPAFKDWGELAQAAYKQGVTMEQVLKKAGLKKWAEFPNFREAWKVVQAIAAETAERPRMM